MAYVNSNEKQKPISIDSPEMLARYLMQATALEVDSFCGYLTLAASAREAGYDSAADVLEGIAEDEEHHFADLTAEAKKLSAAFKSGIKPDKSDGAD